MTCWKGCRKTDSLHHQHTIHHVRFWLCVIICCAKLRAWRISQQPANPGNALPLQDGSVEVWPRRENLHPSSEPVLPRLEMQHTEASLYSTRIKDGSIAPVTEQCFRSESKENKADKEVQAIRSFSPRSCFCSQIVTLRRRLARTPPTKFGA